MKLKEIKVGQIVTDKYNNEYKVLYIDKNDALMPVKLKCTKFLQSILVQKFGGVEFEQEGQRFYIYKSNKVARNDGCNAKCITVKSLRLVSDVE